MGFGRSFAILAGVLFLSCCKNHNNNDQVRSKRQYVLWREDSCGCKGLRDSVRNIVFQSKEELNDFSRDEVVNILGKPDFIDEKGNYCYYSGTGPQCTGEESDVADLKLSFGLTGKVIKVEKVIH